MKKMPQAVSKRRMKGKSQQTIPLKNKTKLINKKSQSGKKKAQSKPTKGAKCSKRIKKSTKRWRQLSSLKITIISLLCAALIVSGIGIWFHFGICFVSNEQSGQQAVVIQRQKEINLFDQVVFRIGTGDQSQTYLCRVVGLPGDSIWRENNSIFINHSLEETIRISPQNKADELPTGTLALKMSDNSLAQELGTFENLPQYNYLLLSDDVDNLNDSRSFGTIPRRNIEGVVLF